MEYIYYCPKCNDIECHDQISGKIECSECWNNTIPLRISKDDWNKLSNEEMLSIIDKAGDGLKRPVRKTTPMTKAREDSSRGSKRLLIPIALFAIAIFFVAVALLIFVLRPSTSKPAKEAMSLINSIGTVTEESGEAIIKAEKYYDTLSEGQKDEVENYKVLIDAREAFDLIQKEKNAAAIESQLNRRITSISTAKVKKQSDIDEIKNMCNSLPATSQAAFSSKIADAEKLTEYEEKATIAIRALRNALKDSGSLVVHSISVGKGTSKALSPFYVYVDYSANNSFGGTKDDSTAIDITSANVAGWWQMNHVFGGNNKQAELNLYNDWLNNCTEKEDLDVDRIMNNL